MPCRSTSFLLPRPMDRARIELQILEKLENIERGQDELRRDIQGLRTDIRRQRNGAPALVAALTDYFGPGRFTTSGLLALAEDEPHSEIANALADLIDMNALPRGRATALGSLLARLPEVEVVDRQRGVAVYRLRTSGPEVR